MADLDIMPYRSGSGGHNRITNHTIEAAGAYDRGDVVRLTAAGEVEEAATEPLIDGTAAPGAGAIGVAASSTAGIVSAFSSQDTQASANSDGLQVPVYLFSDWDQEWVTRNLEVADTDGPFGDVPAANTIGDLCNLRLGSGVWGVGTHISGANRNFQVTRVLDADGEDVARSGNAGVSVVFRRAI